MPLVWVVCTACNLTKAVHIDDTAHLEIAQAFLADPLHAMSATVNWSKGVGPVHYLNQPHLFFYALALTMSLPGPGLLWSHLLVAGCVALGLCFFQRLLRRAGLSDTQGALCSVLLFLGPAFLPGQNLMTDVPLLAAWLAFFWALLDARLSAQGKGLWWAALCCSVACLIKYTSVALIPVLLTEIWLSKRRAWHVLSVPLAVLGAWSAFNWYDYGGVHILGRKVESAELGVWVGLAAMGGRAVIWVLTLGAIAPFTLMFFPRAARRFGVKRPLLGVALLVGLFAPAAQFVPTLGVKEFLPESWLHSCLRPLFFCNGVLVLMLAGSAYGCLRSSSALPEPRRALLGVSSSWIICSVGFVVGLSPFIAVRHVLLTLPALIVLLVQDEDQERSAPAFAWGLAWTVLLGVGTAMADWRYADVYRTESVALKQSLAGERRVLFIGHWGMQWYAKQAGFEHYIPEVTQLNAGDLLVRPRVVDQPKIAASDQGRLKLEQTQVVPAGPRDLLRTVTPVGGFYSVWQGLPWTVTTAPLEAFEILRVE